MHLPNIKIVKKKEAIKKGEQRRKKTFAASQESPVFFLFSFSEKDGECWNLEGSRGWKRGGGRAVTLMKRQAVS